MTREPEPSWLPVLREAARTQAARLEQGCEVMRGARPRWFDIDAARVLSSCLLAAFVIAAAVFRARVSNVPFDLIALLLRAASAAFVVRAALALATWVRRVRGDASAPSCTLALGPEGICLLTPDGEACAAKEDVLGLAIPERVESRTAPPREEPIHLVLKPRAGLRLLTIPPYFAVNQEILAARLQRWLARDEAAPATRFDPPQGYPEERYARIARGALEAGELSVPEGFGYRMRAPYGVLLGCFFAFDAVRAAGPLGKELIPGALAACSLALAFLLGWLVWMGRRRKSRLGIAMALTREELLLRGRAGTVSVPWGQLVASEVGARLAWSPFFGSYPTRTLLLSTSDGERISFDGGFLGVPPEVVAVLCESYRRRLV